MITTEIIENSALPYRINIGGLQGAGITPSRATLAALSVGNKIPLGCRDRKQAASHIFWGYEANPDWVRIIHILEADTFEEEKE